jgi:hypothetical protein
MVSGVGSSSMSFASVASTFPTTDMNDGKGVDIIEPTSTGMFVYLGKTVRLLRHGATGSNSGIVTATDEVG